MGWITILSSCQVGFAGATVRSSLLASSRTCARENTFVSKIRLSIQVQRSSWALSIQLIDNSVCTFLLVGSLVLVLPKEAVVTRGTASQPKQATEQCGEELHVVTVPLCANAMFEAHVSDFRMTMFAACDIRHRETQVNCLTLRRCIHEIQP